MAAAVALLSALTVFVCLCERDHSFMLSASRQGPYSSAPANPSQLLPVVSSNPAAAPDNITRVTVPAMVVDPPASITQPKPSGAISNENEMSVARSRSELLALEKRGSRHYAEFALARSKRFQRLGPVSVGLWKVDAKRKLYDVCLIADGHRVDRKRVTLYSPVFISSNKFAQPLQFVVNSIDRTGVSGYLSEPNTTR